MPRTFSRPPWSSLTMASTVPPHSWWSLPGPWAWVHLVCLNIPESGTSPPREVLPCSHLSHWFQGPGIPEGISYQ